MNLFVFKLPSALESAVLYAAALSIFIVGSVIFTILDFLPKYKCKPEQIWWRNKSIRTDLFYVIINPIFKIFLRFVPVLIVVAPLLVFVPIESIYNFIVNARGPFSRFSIPLQCVAFFIVSDFMLYWNHRIFHQKLFWPIHAIHHSPEDVDWTTAYRFHPLNFVFGQWIVTTIMIFLGVSPEVIIFVAPVEAAMAVFVHSNLNVTLGFLRYFVATPVFHRWHHTHAAEAGNKNFGANLAIWDVIFKTFYVPKIRPPSLFGIEGNTVRENYISQLIYPFTCWIKSLRNSIL